MVTCDNCVISDAWSVIGLYLRNHRLREFFLQFLGRFHRAGSSAIDRQCHDGNESMGNYLANIEIRSRRKRIPIRRRERRERR
jgi:hypothetical protein